MPYIYPFYTLNSQNAQRQRKDEVDVTEDRKLPMFRNLKAQVFVSGNKRSVRDVRGGG